VQDGVGEQQGERVGLEGLNCLAAAVKCLDPLEAVCCQSVLGAAPQSAFPGSERADL